MKFIVWVKDPENPVPGYEVGPRWTEQGDGPLSEKTAKRIASEIRRDCPGVKVKILPKGFEP